MSRSDFEYWFDRLMYKSGWDRKHPLLRALQRGIGVHRAGLPRAYTDVVETAFRAKYIQIVIATSTLSMGINMPCKSVCFAGDYSRLTPLTYQQMAGTCVCVCVCVCSYTRINVYICARVHIHICALITLSFSHTHTGRAGRRGYDDVGHVVFFGVSPKKALRLVKAPLPSLDGYFPITSTLVLRWLHFAAQSSNDNYATEMARALISVPFLNGTGMWTVCVCVRECMCVSVCIARLFSFSLSRIYKLTHSLSLHTHTHAPIHTHTHIQCRARAQVA
jgi:hypothetical protein